MFAKQTRTYASPAIEHSPFIRAQQAWVERIGSARVQARNWRLMALAATAVTAALAAGLVYEANQTRVAAYVVQVEPSGRVLGNAELLDGHYDPSSAQVAYHVAELVRLTRSKPTDAVVLRQDWDRAYHYLAGEAVTAMNEYAAKAGLFDVSQRDTAIEAEVVNVLQRSRDTYQVRWRQTRYEHGSKAGVTDWAGLFTTRLVPPRTSRAVFDNPLGVYVTSFTWGPEYGGGGGGDAATPATTAPSRDAQWENAQ